MGFGLMRMKYICTRPTFLCGMMDVTVGSLRGLGYSITPMLVSLTGACAFRVVWIFTVFVWSRSLDTLYVSYPVSWLITAAVQLLCFFIAMKRIRVQTESFTPLSKMRQHFPVEMLPLFCKARIGGTSFPRTEDQVMDFFSDS